MTASSGVSQGRWDCAVRHGISLQRRRARELEAMFERHLERMHERRDDLFVADGRVSGEEDVSSDGTTLGGTLGVQGGDVQCADWSGSPTPSRPLVYAQHC